MIKQSEEENQLLLFVLGCMFGGTVGVFAAALCIAAKYGDKMEK